MELNDLRRQWQQAPDPAGQPALSSADLNTLLKGRTAGLVEKMRRNAWLEIGLSVPLTVLLAVGLTKARGNWPWLSIGLLLLLVVVGLFYYRRLLGVLRRMSEPGTSVREHLATLAQGLRYLLHFYYRLTLWTGPVTTVLVIGYYANTELTRPRGAYWREMGLAAGVMLVFAAMLQVGIMYGTRWYVQRLYGQHLDRLESQLHELDEQ
ncbi:MAG: hypothetical protein ACRYFX_06480 [Janthinobacterium lividum]